VTDAAFLSLADEKYVVITTTKKSGAKVPTPVWIARLDDGSLGFTTDLTSGKVKRIRNYPDVTLQPSNSRGVVKPGSSPVAARATVLSGAEAAPTEAAISAKYGFMVKLINTAQAARRLVTRSKPAPPCAIRLEAA
jgi:uncharacterized protein